MKKINNLLFCLLLLSACGSDVKDTEKPSILFSENSFPQQCDTLYFDTEYTIRIGLSDNIELGAFRYDIHHNFDHHTHTTELEICVLDDMKTPVNAFVLLKNIDVPAQKTNYETSIPLFLPSTNAQNELYDEGDYHFFMMVTDKSGWSTSKGLSVKILHKD